jgi:hypothetical protein
MMFKRKNTIFFVLAFVLLLNSISIASCTPSESKKNQARPKHWAVAIYRIRIQNWNGEEAINEMVYGGCNFNRLYSHLKKFVRKF